MYKSRSYNRQTVEWSHFFVGPSDTQKLKTHSHSLDEDCEKGSIKKDSSVRSPSNHSSSAESSSAVSNKQKDLR
jgi:hypothetical protein